MKIALFPFTDQFELLSQKHFLNHEINAVIAESGWYDFLKSSQNRINGVDVLDQNSDLSSVDGIIVLWNSGLLCNKNTSDFLSKCKMQHIQIMNPLSNETVEPNISMVPINATVVFNASMIGGCYHFDVDVGLKKKLEACGAKVSVVSCHPFGELLGFKSISSSLLVNHSIKEMTKWINDYFVLIEKNEKPNVIIVSIQESANPRMLGGTYNSIINHAITNAIMPDYVVLNVYMENEMESKFMSIIREAERSLGFKIDSVLLSDFVYEQNNMNEFFCYRGDEEEHLVMYKKLCELNGYDGVRLYSKIDNTGALYKDIIDSISKRGSKNVYGRYL